MAVHGKCSANVGGRCHLIKASKAGSRIKGAFMKDYTNISQKQRRNHSRASRETKKWEVRSWRNHLVQTVLFLDHMSVYLLGSSSLCRLAAPTSLSTWQKWPSQAQLYTTMICKYRSRSGTMGGRVRLAQPGCSTDQSCNPPGLPSWPSGPSFLRKGPLGRGYDNGKEATVMFSTVNEKKKP